MIACCYFIFEPLKYTGNGIKSFNVIQLFLLLPIIVCVAFTNEGFHKASKILMKITCMVIVILIVINIPYINNVISQFMDLEIKAHLYNILGFRTCTDMKYLYEYEEMVNGELVIHSKCGVVNDNIFDIPSYFPKVSILFGNIIPILIFLAFNQTIQIWGERYKREYNVQTIPLFKYKDFNKISGKTSSNRFKYFMSHFFEYYGHFIVHLLSIVCAYFQIGGQNLLGQNL